MASGQTEQTKSPLTVFIAFHPEDESTLGVFLSSAQAEKAVSLAAADSDPGIVTDIFVEEWPVINE